MFGELKVLVVVALLASSMAFSGSAAAQSGEETAPTTELLDSALRDLVAAAGASPTRSAVLVTVEAHYNGTSAEARVLVEAAGGVITGEVDGWLVQADVPASNLEALEAQAGIDFLRVPGESDPIWEPPAPEPGPGQAVSGQHVFESNADDWHAAGWSGAGLKIGVIDTFNQLDWNSAITSGDLPAVSGTFCQVYGATCDIWGGGDHGNNVAEVIYDMAPGVELYIATVFTAADVQAAVNYFDTNDVDIISQSQTNRYDGPGDGSGPFGAVVDDAIAKGMAWFNAAGNNSGTTGNGSYWRGTWTDTDGDGWMNFNGGDEDLRFYATFQNGVRWDDWGEADPTDFDVCVYGSPNAVGLLGCSGNNQTGGADPLEIAPILNYNTTNNYMRIYLADAGAGAGSDIIEFMQNGGGIEASSNPGNAGGPFSDSANAGSMSIGAIDPPTGNTIAPYSSWGPTNDGRTKPDMSGQACLITSLTGCFNGTSSATPVVAGAAALILQSGRATSPAGVVAYLRNESTVDRGVAGVDNIYGWGELLLPAPCVNDAYEDNDDQASATSMANGTVLSASVCEGDDDWYSLQVTEGQDISVDLTFSHASGDVDLQLMNPAGTLVSASGSGSDNESVTHTALTSGIYAARVYGYNGAENTYQIDMHRSICPVDDAYEENDSLATATALTNGVAVSAIACDIPGAGLYDVDWFALPVQAGDTVTATAEFTHAGGDLTTVLYEPSGTTQLSVGVSSTDDEVASTVAQEDGDYPVLVFGNGGQENEYDMTMTASCLDDGLEPNDIAATATGLTNGGAQSGLLCSGNRDWFALPVPAGVDITVDVQFTDALGDLDVYLYGPDGFVLWWGNSASDNESTTLTAPASGIYTLEVYGYLTEQNFYDITVSTSICPVDDSFEPNDSQATAAPLTSGVTESAISCNTDWYSIPVVAGQTIDADIEFSHAVGDLALGLFTPGGTQVESENTATDNEAFSHVATESGNYGVLVLAPLSEQNAYDVTLSAACTDDVYEDNDTQATATPLVNGVAVNGRACTSDDDWFSISATAGELITVVADFVDADGDIDMRLFDPSGTQIDISATTSDGEAITRTAAVTGTYALRVYRFNGGENEYSVSLTTGAHPLVRPFGVVAVEGDVGTSTVQAVFYLEDAAGDPYEALTPVTVNWATGDIASNPSVAHPGSDFVATSGVITFLPGESTAFGDVDIIGDTVDEP
ncbi:MAG: hypothetical protein ACI9C1_003497, partial [Candidatus Aldehydirespiratoraceae bacterium]